MPIRDIYLKIETIPGYSPVAPDPMPAPPRQYARDCMRNPGHEDGTVPLAEVNARTLTALVYREYLDPNYLIPKPDKLVLADINEPPFQHRVPGAVIYTRPGERLRIHVLNCDTSPHSLHVHGLSYGIDSDGSWPLGTQNTDGRRSDEICPGQSWTYTFDVTDKMIGAWPFHDHWQHIADNINRGLFGGIIVLPRQRFPRPPLVELPADLEKLLQQLKRMPFRPLPPGPGPLTPHHGGGGMPLAMGMPMAMRMPMRKHEIALDDPRLGAHVEFLKEWVHLDYVHPRPRPDDMLHVPIFFHFMSGPAGAPAFDSGAMTPGAAFEVTFGTPGTFNYHCTFHPMAGKVTVAAVGPALATVSIEDSPSPRFNPPEVTIGAGGKVRWTHVGNQTHSVTEDAAGVPSFCFNGRSFVGNTPTILAHTGQRIRWYVFNLDLGMMWHNYHVHGQRWQFAGEVIDTRSIGPAESFVVETTAPPVLLLPPEIQKTQSPKMRPRNAKAVRVRGDFLFHCHVEMHMMAGLTGLVRSRQTLWLTPAQADQVRHETGLPEDHGDNDCQPVDPNRCEMLDCGRWEEVTGIPEVCMMHVMPLPGTKQILYWGYGDTRDDISRLWDYSAAAGAYSAPANQPFDVALGANPAEKRSNANLWSAEHAFLDNAEGTVLAHGGFTPRQSYFFHSSTLLWERIAPTHEDRFYATTFTLADGKLLTLFGSASKSIEVYDPAAGTWSAPVPLPPLYDFLFYPWTYLLPGGDLFIAGTGDMGGAVGGVSHRFHWATPDPPIASYPTIGGNRSGGGEKGTSVLLALRPPDYKPRVIILGGNTPGNAQTAEWIDLSAASPAWTSLPNLNIPRGEQVNSVLLPDGRVMVAGGVPGVDGGPVEIFDPQNPAAGWQRCAVMKYTRGYHSTAVLLADGSVLMGGDTVGGWKSGETTPNERYYPWYYFRARPVITSAPASTNYGATFSVNTPDAGSIAEAVLIRPGAVTHGFNMSQRFVGCEIAGVGAASIDVTAPPDGNVAPPGWYLLFIVNTGRVPSEAAWIQLTP
jgi:plastocyanin